MDASAPNRTRCLLNASSCSVLTAEREAAVTQAAVPTPCSSVAGQPPVGWSGRQIRTQPGPPESTPAPGGPGGSCLSLELKGSLSPLWPSFTVIRPKPCSWHPALLHKC